MTLLDMTEHLQAILLQSGERLAAVDNDRSITYRDLNRLSDDLAGRLLAAGALPGERVVLAIDRSVYALVGIVAAIKAGLAYVPQEWDGLDEHVFDRIHDSDQSLFLTRSAFSAALDHQGRRVIVIDSPDASAASGRPLPTTTTNALLYTIYTSGSTGVAKGVDISRSNVLHYAQALSHLLGIDEPLSYAYVSSLAADLGNTCIFLSLFSGGTLHLIDDATRRDAARFQAYLAEHRIDVLKITPSHFVSLCDGSHAAYQLKWLIFGGESLPADLARSVLLRGQASHVANHYGPTETTIGVACYPMRTLEDVPASGSVPVGFPIGNTVLELVDERGAILAAGPNVQGELMIGGPSVGIGYCNDSALTERKFGPLAGCPDGGRFYASGDLFLRTDQGAYIFVGRKDRQVKVRGYRVDPEAIEAVILQHCDVSAAAVLAIQADGGPHIRLVAAVVPGERLQASPAETLEAIQETLRRVLPAHQMPARVLLLDTLPITGNGKADLKALKAVIDQSPGRTSDTLDLDSVDAEPRLVALAHQAWIRYTGVPPASLDDNFYAAGGDSILAIQLLSALQGDDVSVTAATFYATPTFGGLMASLHSGRAEAGPDTITTSERHLAPIQQWFFEMFPDGPDHWAQTVLIDCAKPVDLSAIRTAVERLLQAYPILSTAFTRKADAWLAGDAEADAASNFGVQQLGPDDSVAESIQAAAGALRLSTGRLFRVLLLRQQGQPDRLAMICHHLVVDGVSWRILLDDLARLYSSTLQGVARAIAIDPRSYWSWSKRLKEWAEALPAAEAQVGSASQHLLADFNTGANDEGSTAVCWLGYGESSTYALLHDLPRHLDIPIQNILLACFVRAAVRTFGRGKTCIPVDIETHGRHLFAQEMDLSRAVGWFTALSPWMLEAREHETLKASAERIQRCLADLPHKGVEHGARRYLAQSPEESSSVPELCFNYLGHFTLDPDPRLAWSWSGEYPGAARAPSSHRIYQLKFTGRVVNGQLAIDLSYSTHRHARNSVEKLLACIEQDLSDALAEVAPDAAAVAPRRLFTEASSTGLLTYMPAALRQDPPKPVARRPQVALLTGATGFIGIYLLRELLAQEGLEVHCLVRSKGEKSAQARLWEQFRWYFPDEVVEGARRRVIVHDGDITAANLNLDTQSYAALAARVDTVFHSAADVRLLAPMDELHRSNVQGTRHMIEFCRHGTPKTLHFVSTLSVAGACPTPGGSVFSEDDLHCGQSFLTPYERSKYEAEVVVRQFMASGGRACIHRTGSVSADATGGFQVNIDSNRVMQSICTYVLSGVVPSREEDLLLCPVDSLAHALVSLAMSTSTPAGTFHLTPPRPFMHDELVPVLRKFGFNVRLDTEAAYLQALTALEASHPREATLGRLWAARVSRGVRIDARRTHECLQHIGTAIPPIDERWFSRFLNRCVARGYLPDAEALSL
ncbi:thioester reductase domain-containing protein [Burkholderia ambifaria]|uniref:Thioester reductase domain protein n=1 Tax=Burkholderia ambifaria MEX-5 TaxID=396597 RepID=B1T4Q0_9BURK|nr:thioester reductase domain-containing protein [Burkholderia ambifaria]EDT41449.1 thioester reductase domain protein [Burkholderia ambifaria MEX-5]